MCSGGKENRAGMEWGVESQFQIGCSGKGPHPKGREEVTRKSGGACEAGGAAKVSEQGGFLGRVGGAWASGLAEPHRNV